MKIAFYMCKLLNKRDYSKKERSANAIFILDMKATVKISERDMDKKNYLRETSKELVSELISFTPRKRSEKEKKKEREREREKEKIEDVRKRAHHTI